MKLFHLFLFFVAFSAVIQITWGAALPKGNLAIVGGNLVTIEAAPYMVALFVGGKRFVCGGTIVHKQFILTAAHCLRFGQFEYLPSAIKVLISSDYLNNGGIFVDVDRVLVHEGFNNETHHNDISLLRVKQPLINSYFRTAKIWLPEDNRAILEGTMVNVTGWGVKKNRGHASNELLQITIPVVSNVACSKLYTYLNDDQMCAGSQGHDSCQGDSGGPLTYNGVQIGIVSYGARCGVRPGVYTRVSSYVQWIQTIIKYNY